MIYMYKLKLVKFMQQLYSQKLSQLLGSLFTQIEGIYSHSTRQEIASLYVAKKQFFSSKFFFVGSRRKKGFQPVKSFYFCLGQQKKKKLLEKNQ